MRWLVIDGLNLFIRNFCVMPTMDRDGNPIGGLVGFIRTLKNLMNDNAPDRVVVCWDGEGGSRRRRGIFAEYKQGRKVRTNRTYDLEGPGDQQDNFADQVQKLKRVLRCIGTVQVECQEVEADDAIAYLCNHVLPAEDESIVVSSDRDLLQLVGPRCLVYSPSKKVYWTTSEVREKTGVLPENYIFVKALMGDSSDNIPGVGGIGEKTAVKLFPFLADRATTLAEILEHAEANQETSAKYKGVLASKDRLAENVKLMQLSSPIISAQAARTVRESSSVKPTFSVTDLRLDIVRMGLEGVDADLFGAVSTYRRRVES